MRYITGDMFRPSTYASELHTDKYALAITTNGFVKKGSGESVMGRGCALQAAQLFPYLPKLLGNRLMAVGNYPTELTEEVLDGYTIKLFSFPVKPRVAIVTPNNIVQHMKGGVKIGQEVPGWMSKADLHIVKRSAHMLRYLLNATYALQKIKAFVLPMPGCGAGEMSWERDVRPIMESAFQDDPRIFIISKG